MNATEQQTELEAIVRLMLDVPESDRLEMRGRVDVVFPFLRIEHRCGKPSDRTLSIFDDTAYKIIDCLIQRYVLANRKTFELFIGRCPVCCTTFVARRISE